MSSQENFPVFYRVAFAIFDIAMPLFGVFVYLSRPDFVLSGFTSSYLSPAVPETRLLMDAMAGWFASLAFLNIAFLRTKYNDLDVWRAMQAATLLVDVFQLVGFGRVLYMEDRLATTKWHGTDWGNICGYLAIATVRIAFLLRPRRTFAQRKGKLV